MAKKYKPTPEQKKRYRENRKAKLALEKGEKPAKPESGYSIPLASIPSPPPVARRRSVRKNATTNAAPPVEVILAMRVLINYIERSSNIR